MPSVLRCPSCFQLVEPQDLQCPRCELLLDGQLDQPAPASKEISVVKALIEAPQARAQRGPPPPPPDLTPPNPVPSKSGRRGAATRAFRALPELANVPRVVAELRLQELNLTPFEAWVVSLIDGHSTGLALQPAVGLAALEFQVVLATLVDKGVLALNAAPLKTSKAPIDRVVRPPVAPEPVAPPVLRPPSVASPVVRPSTPAPPRPGPQPRPAPSPPAHPGEAVEAKPAAHNTDPRIRVGEGVVKNRKLLDALKQVKRADPPVQPSSPSSTSRPVSATALAPASPAISDLASESVLQVAIRMEQDGKRAEAIRYLERAIARSPDAAPLYNRLAIILVRDRRDFREAERLLKKALAIAPENEVYKKNLVSILHGMAGG